MAVRFIPNGILDVKTDPSRLPSQILSDGTEVSGAMTRCTNLDVDDSGIAVTRKGSSKINSSALDQVTPHLLIEMDGNRYSFAGTKIYFDESEIGAGFTSTRWSALKYSAFNVEEWSIFATNGTDRKRITNASTVTQKYNYAYTQTWEANQVSGTTYQFGTTEGNYQRVYDWEEADDDSIDDSIARHYQWFFESIVVQEWGIEAPTAAPVLSSTGEVTGGDMSSGYKGFAYTYLWEGQKHVNKTNSFQLGKMRSAFVYTAPSSNELDGYIYRNRTITGITCWRCIHDWEKSDAKADTSDYKTMWLFEGIDTYDELQRVGVQYTYVRKNGTTVECESNPSPAEYIEARIMINVTWTLSDDPQVTHVRIYRTLPAGSTFYYADEFEVHDLTGVTSKEDYALGSEVATDHDRPPEGSIVAGPTFNGYCFMLKDNKLYFCKPNQPEYWPSTYYIEVGPPQEELKGIKIYNGVPYTASTEEIYMIQGSGHDSFFPFPMNASTGTLSDKGMLAVAGIGILHSDMNGLYNFLSNEDKKILEDKFGPIFTGETKGSMPGLNRANAVNCWLLYYDSRIWFGYPDSTATYPNNMIVINMTTGKPRHYSYSQEFGAVTIDNVNNRILALDSTGYVRILDDSSVTADDGTAIDWEIESKAYVDQLYKYFPRSAKYDVELIDSGASATGEILLSDETIQTHAITDSRNTRKRLIDGNNGDRLGVRLTGTGTVKIREVEVQ